MPKRPHETDDGHAAPDAKRTKVDSSFEAVNLSHADYTIGWICALPKEQTAAIAMLDQKHPDLPSPTNDDNVYTLGSVGGHNVVIACLPKGRYGTNSAATIATKMVGSFPSIKFGLLVGIRGGIPSKVRLGDVVVSTPVDQYLGVVQWDFGKAEDGGEFKRTGSLNSPPNALLKVLSKLETEHEMQESKVAGFLDEMKQKWPRLYPKYFWNASLKDPQDEDRESEANAATIIAANEPQTRRPDIHHGLIASGNQVIKDAAVRDRLDEDLDGNLLCIKMEAAGLMNDFPCLVVRGICDYADSGKNKNWQEYAAAVAAAFAKEILFTLQVWAVERMDPVKDILSNINAELGNIRTAFSEVVLRQSAQCHQGFLDWLTPTDYTLQQIDYFNKRQPGTGIPGAGKTIFTSIIVNDLFERFKFDTTIGIAYVYCNFRRHDEQKLQDLLASLIKQLARDLTCLPQETRAIFDTYTDKSHRPSLDDSRKLLQQMAAGYSRVFILLDALDECQTLDGCRKILLDEMFFLRETTKTNIFATSRFIPEITARFEACNRIEIRADENDVRRYVQSQLEGGNIEHLPSLVKNKPELKVEIIRGISNAVDGMFPLAKIYLDTLVDKITIKDVRDAVTQLPKQMAGSGEAQRLEILNQAYEFAWERINGQKEGFRKIATRVLQWIVCAKRPLSTKELQHALAVTADTDELDADAIPQVHDMMAFCAGLVTLDEESNIIRLVHYTTQEYFEKKKNDWFPDAETMIAKTCITYLSFATFGECCVEKCCIKSQLDSEHFLEYACYYWGDHTRVAYRNLEKTALGFLMSGANASNACTVMLKELHFEKSRKLSWDEFESHRRLPTSGLHLAAHFGLYETIKPLLSSGYDINGIVGLSMTPLLIAIRKGHIGMAEMLLDNAAYILPDHLQRLSDAAMEPKIYNVKLVERLIAMRTDNDFLSTFLKTAVQLGHDAIVELLLRKGVYIDTVYPTTGYRPLHEAVKFGQGEIVKLLLTKGVNIDVQTQAPTATDPLSDYKKNSMEIIIARIDQIESCRVKNFASTLSTHKTSLHMPKKPGNREMVKRMFDEDRRRSTRFKSGNTPLHVAAQYGQDAIIQLLLDKGANTEALNDRGRTPLFSIVDHGRLEGSKGDGAIDLLLKGGANMEAVDDKGYTPLLLAAKRGSHMALNSLMKRGANANAVAYGGQSSLHLATRDSRPQGYGYIIEKWR